MKTTMVCGRCGVAEHSEPWSFGRPRRHDAAVLGFCEECSGNPDSESWPSFLSFTSERLDGLPWGIVTLAPDGRVLDCNIAAQRISGLSRNQVIGKNFFRVVAPDTNVDCFRGTFRDLVLDGTFGHVELDFLFNFATRDVVAHVAMMFEPNAGIGALVLEPAT